MDNLIISVLSGAASPFEEERLKRWRDLEPENEQYFQEMGSVWALTEPEPVVHSSRPPEVEEIIRATPVSIRRRTFWMRWGLLAASVSAVALGIKAVGVGGPELSAVHEATSQEALGVTLRDGSFVRLAPGSELREWASDARREVSLQGRAFFAVAKDPAHPFVIRAGSGQVEVLGTRFQVDTREDQVETVVVEGLVSMSNGSGQVQVPAGSVAKMARGEKPEGHPVEDVYALLDWPGGTLIFQATPLHMVAQEVSRFYGRELGVEAGPLESRRVTAAFLGNTFDEVAESLCLVTEARCVGADSGISMRSPEGL